MERLRYTPKCSRLIYNIYSRTQKQLGEPLKDPWKTAEKLAEWRIDTPECNINEIHDIIGITIVVNFPSDRQKLADFLQENGNIPGFRIDWHKEKEKDGYHAHHLKVRNLSPAYSDLFCEIQIKTMLHDGWGAKTHDLTYKPPGELDEKLDTHMKILGDVLRLLDEQSEIIKEFIYEKWNLDKSRKDVASQELFMSLCRGTGQPYDEPVKRLATRIANHRDHLSWAKQDDEQLVKLDQDIQKLVKKYKWNSASCRVAIFLASIRQTNDLDNYAINAIERWRRSAKSMEDKMDALIILSLANYSFGRFSEAVEAARKALNNAKNHCLDTMAVTKCKMNLAYFIAEAHYHNKKKFGTRWVNEAKKLAKEALDSVDPNRKARYLDTIGAISIACGTEESEIRIGLTICENALNEVSEDAKERPAAEAFFRLHEQRAFHRILELRSHQPSG